MRKKFRTAKEVEGEQRFLENTLERLTQSFDLEKDQALENSREEGIKSLRERVKLSYAPECRMILNRLRELKHLSERLDDIPSGIFRRMEELEKKLKEARAHFTGTVNRLSRNPRA